MFKFFTSGVFWCFIVLPVASVSLIVACHDEPHRYVGVVTSVSSWNGDATLKTKTETRKDTTLKVVSRRNEHFEGKNFNVDIYLVHTFFTCLRK